MMIEDKIYGVFEIGEPVLIELINSEPIQRLKRVANSGVSAIVLKNRGVSRYDHSLGVMILLRILGASIEEQVAGLLHDVSHTAFSHVIDHVFRKKDYDFHEEHQEEILNKGGIKGILKKYGFSLERVIDSKNFGLLEREVPDLCADRIDYFFRDLGTLRQDFSWATNLSKKLIVNDGEIVV